MDDFRLGPISPADSYGDRQTNDPRNRRKAKPSTQELEAEDEIVLAEPEGSGDGGTEDYYTPSGRGKPE